MFEKNEKPNELIWSKNPFAYAMLFADSDEIEVHAVVEIFESYNELSHKEALVHLMKHLSHGHLVPTENGMLTYQNSLIPNAN